MTVKSFLAAASVVALCAYSVGEASAATVTYTNAEATPKMELTIDDSGVNSYRFSLSTLVGTADFLALGFNLFGSLNPLTSASFSLVSATNASNVAITPSLVLFGNDTGSQATCGTGCNFNGAGSASTFDYILRIGEAGGNAANYVKTVVFDLAYTGSLADNPFSQLALRAQSTSNPGGSIKTDLVPDGGGVTTPVPLPAGLPLLLSGMALAGVVARRKSRKA